MSWNLLAPESTSNHVFMAGLGVEARAWKVKIVPQVRYLRWAQDQHVTPFAPAAVPDQTEFLVSIYI
jgi:hypothetical protein